MKHSFVQRVRLHAPLHRIEVSHSAPRKPAPTAEPTTSPSASAAPMASAAPPKPPSTDEIVAVLRGISEQIDGLESARAQNLRELQVLAIELGVQVASHIVRQKLEADEFPLEDLVGRAVQDLLPCEALTIKVNPADLRKIEAMVAEEFGEVAERTTVVETPDLPLGSCLVTGGGHGLLSTLDDRLEAIRTNLLQGIEHARIERRKSLAASGALRRFPDRRKLA